MERDYWLGRWKRGETGWHQTEVESALIAYFSDLQPMRVFVPLCGKSLDLKWLIDQGHEVVGVELSEIAIREFGHENEIVFQETECGKFKKFQAERITLFQGDFFELTPQEVGPLEGVYDRAALIAMSPELRDRYSEQLVRLATYSAGKLKLFLQIVLEREPSKETEGPPFSISDKELLRLYGNRFDLIPLSYEKIDSPPGSASLLFEAVYRLDLRP